MIKNLTTHGNSLALILEKGVLDLLNIKKETPLEIATDGTNIIISRSVRPRGRRPFGRRWPRSTLSTGKPLKSWRNRS